MRSDHVAVRLLHYILIFGGLGFEDEQLSLHKIWMFNMYTEQWRKYVVPSEKSVPSPTTCASATVIRSDIYMFGGEHTRTQMHTNELWKLIRTPQGCFSWNQIEFQSKTKTPSPRAGHIEWEHAEKMWIFGGLGEFPDGYLHDHGDFESEHHDNNQLLCFDPLSQDWTNPKSFGSIPPPAAGHAAARIGDRVWLYEGVSHSVGVYCDNLYQLDMSSLTWALMETGHMKPHDCMLYTLTAASDNYLVMHAQYFNVASYDDTWILDVNAMSWKPYQVGNGEGLQEWEAHTSTRGINSMVIILGGKKPVINISVMLEPKTLQQLAMQRIHTAKDELPLQVLPKKLISLLDLS